MNGYEAWQERQRQRGFAFANGFWYCIATGRRAEFPGANSDGMELVCLAARCRYDFPDFHSVLANTR